MSTRTPPPTTIPPRQNPVHIASGQVWLITFLLIGFALRLYHLGGESLWYDETVSAYLASQSIVDLVAHTARDIHPPAYYLLLHAWRLISAPTVAFGLEFLYAWPSLLLDMLVMALTYAITKRTFGHGAARWAVALAALQPSQIWFAQEVRMYALGAFCVMLTLWAVTPLLLKRRPQQEALKPQVSIPRRTLILYPLAALLGLYTLYYFLFWLLILNFALLLHLWRDRRAVRTWLVLHIVILIGWLPWLPVFTRQALTPPVPPWRMPWQSAAEVIQSLGEALAALWIGHIPPFGLTWLWASLVIATGVFFYDYTKKSSDGHKAWLILCFGSPLLLISISLFGPPIYHVRYISTYAPLFVILLAVVIANLRPARAILPVIIFVGVSAVSTQQLWTNPDYAADDHRNAVTMLAQQWRPGDAILVNAGWVYTVLSVYWPTELPSPTASRPPTIANMLRLTPAALEEHTTANMEPILFRTGSIDGDPSLGWNLPQSDFFAVSRAQTIDALSHLAQTYPRIWHYRQYDTVSDPNGVIRDWLAENSTLEFSQPIPGRDYLLLESYLTNAPVRAPSVIPTRVDYQDVSLSILGTTTPKSVTAGEILYTRIDWRTTAESDRANLALSLRLLDDAGRTIRQSDGAFDAVDLGDTTQMLSLPIPAGTIPGQYHLYLIVYSPTTLAPYPATQQDGTLASSSLLLSNVAIELPHTPPNIGQPHATFDYIDLLQAALPTTPLQSGAAFDTTWTWHPRPSNYRDHYRAELQLVTSQSDVISLANFDLGDTAYPSSLWPASYPILQHETITLPDDVATGTYTMRLTVLRVSDGAVIDARQPWQPWSQPAINIGSIDVVSRE